VVELIDKKMKGLILSVHGNLQAAKETQTTEAPGVVFVRQDKPAQQPQHKLFEFVVLKTEGNVFGIKVGNIRSGRTILRSGSGG
jgi:hypothetical protein